MDSPLSIYAATKRANELMAHSYGELYGMACTGLRFFTGRLADRSYDDVRPAYQLGHIASMNPDYNGRSFDEVEPELRYGWGNDLRARHGDWSAVRPYAEEAYSRSASVDLPFSDATSAPLGSWTTSEMVWPISFVAPPNQ